MMPAAVTTSFSIDPPFGQDPEGGTRALGPGPATTPVTTSGTNEPQPPRGTAAGDDAWAYGRSDRSRRNGPLRRRFRDLRRRVTAPLVPALAPRILRLVAWTWRVQVVDGHRRQEVMEHPEGAILVLWHGRMAVAAPVFRGVRAFILVSASGDGKLANMLLERLGYGTLRGSTRKAGVQALRRMRTLLADGHAVTITPDGPRGPRHHVNRGAVFLARETGRPILPIGFGVARAARLNSWDRFTIPLPFSKVCVVLGEPLLRLPEGTEDDLEAAAAAVGDALLAAETRAFAELGEEIDW